jgi:general secretion pathway protein A
VRRAAREVAGEGARPWRRPRAGVVIAATLAVFVVAAGVAERAGAWRLPSLRVLRNVRLTATPEVAPGTASVAAASASTSPMAGLPPRPVSDLATQLAAVGPPLDQAAALARVLARWGVTVSPGEDPCRAAAQAGLECYDGRGTWTVVRRLGVPVTVKLVTADGARYYAPVTALDGDLVTLQLGERLATLPLAAVDKLWDGTFSVVWRPLPGVARVLGPGMQGPGVAWLRRALGDGDITARERGPAVYDEALAVRVVAFQKREGLEADGMAGIETLVRLSTRLDVRAPLLASEPAAR